MVSSAARQRMRNIGAACTTARMRSSSGALESVPACGGGVTPDASRTRAAALRSAHCALTRSCSVGASRSTVALNRLPCATSLVTVTSPPIMRQSAG